jgi:hypothetical protein
MKINKLVITLFTSVIVIMIVIASFSTTVLAGKPWQCTASCNVQAIEGKAPKTFPERVTGFGSNNSQDEACTIAKRDATQKAVAGTYARHCQCDCKQ